MAARDPDTTMWAASICGRTYSVSTAVMPSANFVRRGTLRSIVTRSPRATYQHEAQITPDNSHGSVDRRGHTGRGRGTRQPGPRQHSAGRHPAHGQTRGLHELARRELRGLV